MSSLTQLFAPSKKSKKNTPLEESLDVKSKKQDDSQGELIISPKIFGKGFVPLKKAGKLSEPK